MDRVTIRPRAGLAVPMPEGGSLPAEGVEVEMTLYWQRRLADGDVEVAAAEGASDKPEAPPPAKQKKEG